MRLQEPIFVVGCPRSGTTLLRLMLSSHSQISIPPESMFIIEMLPTWHDRSIGDHSDLQDFLGQLYTEPKFGEWQLDRRMLEDNLARNVPLDYTTAISQIYRTYAQEQRDDSAQIWGDKNPGYIFYLPELHGLFPHARFVNIIRDGRAVFSSGLRANRTKAALGLPPMFGKNPYHSYRTWHCALRAAARYKDDSRFTSVRYEDLASNPGKVLAQVCAFLKIDFEPDMLKYAERNRKRELVPSRQLAWHGKTLDAPDKSRSTAWRQELPAQKRRQYEILAFRDLRRYGYDVNLSSQHLRVIGPRLLAWLLASLGTSLYDLLPRSLHTFIRAKLRSQGRS